MSTERYDKKRAWLCCQRYNRTNFCPNCGKQQPDEVPEIPELDVVAIAEELIGKFEHKELGHTGSSNTYKRQGDDKMAASHAKAALNCAANKHCIQLLLQKWIGFKPGKTDGKPSKVGQPSGL